MYVKLREQRTEGIQEAQQQENMCWRAAWVPLAMEAATAAADPLYDFSST